MQDLTHQATQAATHMPVPHTQAIHMPAPQAATHQATQAATHTAAIHQAIQVNIQYSFNIHSPASAYLSVMFKKYLKAM